MGGLGARAARLVAHGAPLEVEQVALADPGPDEAVVEMAYAGVNPLDRYHVLGTVAPDVPLPRTLGVEGVGRMDGRWVVVRGHGLGSVLDGVWTERAVVPRAAAVAVPDGVDPKAAAAIGVAGATAWRTVTELADVVQGDRVLVLGASGGVGTMILSLARSAGATVWGQTGRREKTGVIEAAGADRAVVAPDASSLVGAVRDFRPTVVFDPLGAAYTGAAVEVLEARGRLVLFGTSAGPEGAVPLQALYRKGLTVLGYAGLIEPEETLRRAVGAALGALADGRLRATVDAVLPLEGVNDALARLAAREAGGKLLLSLA